MEVTEEKDDGEYGKGWLELRPWELVDVSINVGECLFRFVKNVSMVKIMDKNMDKI